MGTVIEYVDVAVPIRTAYNQWTQFEDFPQFMAGVTEVRQLSDTMTRWRTEIGGVTREFDARITEQIPDERVAWRAIDGVRQAGVVTFHRLDENHTRVTAQLEFEPHGVAEQAADRLGVVNQRVKADLRRFKSFIEGRGVETGAWRGEVPRPQP
ncbi:MAG TPA: SRPBCC family protein [Micromonosporaceae bacterium]